MCAYDSKASWNGGTSRAVVLGGGVAGLAAAAALGQRFDDVVIIEPDVVENRATTRRGVPHAAQLHNLLGRAQQSLERLFPGYCDELAVAGGCRARASTQTHVVELGVRMPERDLGIDLMSAPRLLIEQVMRSMLMRTTAVRVVEGRAVGLLANGGRVTGAMVERARGGETVSADLVVDATGTWSQTPSWLAALGYEPPPTQRRTGTHWYVTAMFARPVTWHDRDDFWLIFPTSPGTRSGLLSPGAATTWKVSVAGTAADTPPRSHAEVVAYAATLADPMIANEIAEAVPLGRTTLFRKSPATWRHYEHIGRRLAGLLPIGDAMASLDPLYGQGISVATWQAATLADLLETAAPDPRRLTSAYLDAASRACRSAWELGPAMNDIAHDRVRSVVRDPADHQAYVEAWHLLRTVPALAAAPC